MPEQAADREELIHAVFMGALDLPPGERAAFVRGACRDDTLVAAEVLQLLSLHERLAGLDGALDFDDPVGTHVGPYEIVRSLGRGAMGCVYLARRADGLFHKDVAIKLMGVPGRSAPDLRSRFESERRILASLRHPGIAALLDAGQMHDGRLYFIMEYIDGLPLTAHCRQRALTVAQKVQLFQKVCEAVAHAHRSLVVHRDLKPANIIVTADGEPKLLDFGIAKIVTRAALDPDPTDPSMRRATPAYASPEQLEGRPTHTSMDIYALGVILHELLTGRVPETNDAADRSLTAPAHDRDLGAIVARAIAPAWHMRYLSVDDLVADLRAWALSLPVAARQGGWGYRSAKWIRRNSLVATISAAAVAAVVVAVVLALSAWKTDREARVRATRQLDAARTLARDVLSMEGVLAQIDGTTAARSLAVGSLSRYLASVDVLDNDALAVDAARAHRRLGDVEGNPNVPNLGDAAAAHAHYARALTILEPLARSTAVPEVREALAETYASEAEVYFAQGKTDAAEALVQKALEAIARSSTTQTSSAAMQRLTASLHRTLGDVRLAQRDPKSALLEYEHALAADARLRNEERHSDHARVHALTQIRVGDAKAALGAFNDAQAAYEQAADALERLAEGSAQKRGLLRDAALGLGRLGRLLADRDPQRAGMVTRRAIATLEDLRESDPADARARRDLMVALMQYGELSQPFDRAGSHSALRRALEFARQSYAEAPADAARRDDLREVERRLASSASTGVALDLVRLPDASPVEAGGRPIALGDRLRARAARAPEGWSQYLLVFGAHGPAQLLEAPSNARASWSLDASGPGAAQTLILIAAPRPIDPVSRQRILTAVETLPSPRLIDFDSHVVWTDRSETVVSTASTRGARDTGWVSELRRRLAALDSFRYGGRTFPLAGMGF